MENNLSETAFFVAEDAGFRLRWFTPEAEVDLCGHATLGAAHVLFEHLAYAGSEIRFQSNSGVLRVSRQDQRLCLDFPTVASRACQPQPDLIAGLGKSPQQVLAGTDYLAVFDAPEIVAALEPDFFRLAGLDLRGVIATAPGKDCDFVSRCFYPALAVNEDPVTGSAHCQLTPYWAGRLGRNDLTAHQLSRRGGQLFCQLKDQRVLLHGDAVTYLTGTITLPT
ncbi:MAG: PhzF family phenazine biosynthesis protein [Wenzhouxiangellaceae bacterium]|nr:MAG: PhzF family phenazine biosynthesis protein [Wenzhouxiangellaceae bacterium]